MRADTPGASGCDEQALLEFLDGGLPVHQRLQVKSHLEQCEDCRGSLAGFEQALAMTSTVSAPAMDPFVSSGFGARVRRQIEEYGSWRPWGRRWSPVFSGAIAASAAVLLVLAAGDRLSFVESEVPAAAGVQAKQDGNEFADHSGIEQFLESVALLYGDEMEEYEGEVLPESGSPDLDSEVSEYLLDTASEAELLEQMQALVEADDIYALTVE